MSTSVRCIGITGTNGGGKTTLAEFLRLNYSVGYYEVRDFLDAERARRDMPPGRESLRELANELRQKYGPDYIMRTLAEQAMMSRNHNPFIIESIRCVGEVEYLSATFGEGFVLVGVDAPQDVRYKRAEKRDSQTDKVTFEVFCSDEALEMNQSDPWKQNLRACMEGVRKGFKLWNNGAEYLFHSEIRLTAQCLGLEPKTGPQKTA